MKGGKTNDLVRVDARDPASMRPAREGRENPLDLPVDVFQIIASMRPAREGRENVSEIGRTLHTIHASMRPAREGRENIHEIDVPNMRRVVLQ